MALDGAFLHKLKQEIEEFSLGARVEKVYQPAREEIVLLLRGKNFGGKLFLSARANSARVHFTASSFENPLSPPMFCMLLRKKLASARLTGVTQPGLERVLLLEFECVNELGDVVSMRLAVEIMGRYSNIILVDENGKIVDAVKRVDSEMSGERLVLPGMTYELPPAQDKVNLLETPMVEIMEKVAQFGTDQGKNPPLDKALLGVLQGVSPLVCRELHLEAAGAYGAGETVFAQRMTSAHKQRLLVALAALSEQIREKGTPVLIAQKDGKPLEFTFTPVKQYAGIGEIRTYESYSELLDAFYSEKDRLERMRSRSSDLLHLLSNAIDKLSRKINLQRAELTQCADREKLHIYGDLLNANLYRLEKGATEAEVENYYEEGMPTVKIPMDPALSPAQNAQKYYKDYRRAQTAEKMLTEQIAQAEEEIAYLDTVFDALSRAACEQDLNEIRQELVEQGYLRNATKKPQKTAPLAQPMKFTTSGGFEVRVGRNNRENDRLTLKTAGNNDIWFHTKNIPGSHTVLITDGREPGETDLFEAAKLAATHSKAANSSQVPVDYTQIRHVHKPQGAKPGMVIYENYRTIYVNFD